MATAGWENSRIMDNISTNNINISLNYSHEQVQNALNSVYGHPNFVRQLQSTESINIYQFTCHNSIQNIEIIIKKESSSIDLTIRSMYENASKYKRIAIVNLSQSVLNCILDCLENSIYKSKEDFPQEIQNIAGTVLEKEISEQTKIEFTAKLIQNIICFFQNATENQLQKKLEEYKKLSFLIGKQVQVFPIIDDAKSSYTATVLDIDNNANLVVQTEGKTKVLNSGEVSLKI